jgi:hypothetical protein
MTDQSRVRALLVASLVITSAIAAWMHSMIADAGAYDKVRIFLSLFLFQDYPAALLTVPVLLIAVLPPVRAWGLAVASVVGQRPWMAFFSTTALLAVGARFVYQAHPLAMDEYAAVFQSTIFSSGRIFGRFPPELADWLVPRGFQGHFLKISHQTGEVASMYWPGFALVLAPFTRVGLTWLANPLLGGLAVVLVHRLALRLTGSTEAAGLAALLTVASPAVTVNAISLYSMPAHLVFNAAFVLLLIDPTPRRALLAGLLGSFALVLHNPLPHMLLAVPWLLWLVWRPDRWRTVPFIALGYLPLSLLLGFGWMQVLDQIPTTVGHGTASAAAAGAAPGIVSASMDRLAHVNVFRFPGLDTLEDRLVAVAKMWLWAVPGMLLLSVAGAYRARADVHFRLLAWSATLTLLGFLFVPVDQGHGWGFRYFHAAWFTLPLLAVAAIRPVQRAAKSLKPATRENSLTGFVAACALLSLTLLTGQRFVQVGQFMARQLQQIPTVNSALPKVVIVHPVGGYYASDLVQNDPFLRNQPIIVLSQGTAADSRLIAERFPGAILLARNATAEVWGQPVP